MFIGVQAKMMAILGDGELHSPEELHACLTDELSPINNISTHLAAMRKRLDPKGYTIARIEVRGRSRYRLCRHLASPYDGTN